jgi:hypothetical protein
VTRSPRDRRTPGIGLVPAQDVEHVATGTYRLWGTSFEAVNTGELAVSRK